jgi:hypothetical protein
VPNDEIVKGYKVDTDTYIEVSKDELENIALESTRTIDIDEFVPKSSIDPRYLIRPYYIVPDSKVGHDAFAVIRETIRNMDMVAIGRVVLTSREHTRPRALILEHMARGPCHPELSTIANRCSLGFNEDIEMRNNFKTILLAAVLCSASVGTAMAQGAGGAGGGSGGAGGGGGNSAAAMTGQGTSSAPRHANPGATKASGISGTAGKSSMARMSPHHKRSKHHAK